LGRPLLEVRLLAPVVLRVLLLASPRELLVWTSQVLLRTAGILWLQLSLRLELNRSESAWTHTQTCRRCRRVARSP
jgi:hypothetical protein